MKLTKQDRAVIALSVYNAVSLTGHDMTVDGVVEFLRSTWGAAQSPNARRVARDTVTAAAQMLASAGWVMRDGDTIRIEARDPVTRRGQMLGVDYKRGAIVPVARAQ